MIVAAIFYPKTETSRFDEKYYHTTHMKMVHELLTPMGLRGARALYGQPGQDGTPPLYAVVTLLDFEDITAFADAMEVNGAALFGDIPNFTDVTPGVQINRLAS